MSQIGVSVLIKINALYNKKKSADHALDNGLYVKTELYDVINNNNGVSFVNESLM